MQKRSVKRITKNEANASDEPSSESEDSIHHIKEIKKIDETDKHFTTTLKISGVTKVFVIDTGSPTSILRPDHEINRNTENNKPIDVNKNEYDFGKKFQ